MNKDLLPAYNKLHDIKNYIINFYQADIDTKIAKDFALGYITCKVEDIIEIIDKLAL